MQLFDRLDSTTLERREWELWLLSMGMILILAAGVALLMYPLLFGRPVPLATPTLRYIFVGYCGLSVLVVTYLINRQLVIRRLRRQLREEQKQNLSLRFQAGTDLLHSLPQFNHFQDRLAMDFRRAANSQQPLTLLMVRLRPSRGLSEEAEIWSAFGDAAKALLRRLRSEDSLYYFRPGVFGIVLPNSDDSVAKRIGDRLLEALADVAGVTGRFTADAKRVNFPAHVSSATEMETMAHAFSSEGSGLLVHSP